MAPYQNLDSPRYGLHYGAPRDGLPTIFAVAGANQNLAAASYDGGLTWNTASIISAGANAVAVSPELNRVLILGSSGNAVYSNDGGLTWTNTTYPNVGSAPKRLFGWGAGVFAMLQDIGATARVHSSPTGIGAASWSFTDVTFPASSDRTLFWDAGRELWVLLTVISSSTLIVWTSPDAITWTNSFTGLSVGPFGARYMASGPGGRILCTQNTSQNAFVTSIAPALDNWATYDVPGWAEQRVIAGSDTLWFSSGIGGTNGGVSGSGADPSSWTNVTVPWGIDAQFGTFVPGHERFIVLSSGTGTQGGIFTAERPDLGAAAWTRRETTSNVWAGQIAYGIVG